MPKDMKINLDEPPHTKAARQRKKTVFIDKNVVVHFFPLFFVFVKRMRLEYRLKLS